MGGENLANYEADYTCKQIITPEKTIADSNRNIVLTG
jgi:hypothetical protein